MTDEELNSAIAEASGWKPQTLDTDYNGVPWPDEPPDYCNDLNAMHQVECWMIGNMSLMTFWKYAENLSKHMTHLGSDGYIHATARQRAEAFLKTIKKLKEETK